MPDKKRKFETKVHRKTLNPFFNESFSFKQVNNSFIVILSLIHQIRFLKLLIKMIERFKGLADLNILISMTIDCLLRKIDLFLMNSFVPIV